MPGRRMIAGKLIALMSVMALTALVDRALSHHDTSAAAPAAAVARTVSVAVASTEECQHELDAFSGAAFAVAWNEQENLTERLLADRDRLGEKYIHSGCPASGLLVVRHVVANQDRPG